MFNKVAAALIFNALDMVTGFIGAVREKTVSSSRLRDGLFKKAGFVFCYIAAWAMDSYGSLLGFDIAIDILPVVCGYVCMTEIVSILENISHINPDILPDKLIELFKLKRKE